ncbi:MAG: PhnD/SsuA/transferrin family substrate-binding protein [Myxococcota bacterium]
MRDHRDLIPRAPLALFAALLLALLPTAAGAKTVAICHDLGPGNTEQAADKVDRFLAHMARSAGLPEDAFEGAYHTEREACEAYVADHEPVLAVLDLATLLHHAEDWELEPVAHVGPADAVKYHVLVRKGTYDALSDLEGQEIWAALPEDDAYLSHVVLDGEVDAGEAWKLEYTARVLKGLRKVGRGQAAATVVGHEAYEHRGALGLPEELVSIHESPALPGLTLVAVGANEPDTDLVDKVRASLPKLCEGDGEEMCDQLGVKELKPAEAERFEALRRKYEGK